MEERDQNQQREKMRPKPKQNKTTPYAMQIEVQ